MSRAPVPYVISGCALHSCCPLRSLTGLFFDTPPSTVIRKTIGARDTRISYVFLSFSYEFLCILQFSLRFLSTRFLITAISYYQGGRCMYIIYIYTLSHPTPPMPGPQGCEKLHSPIGLLKLRARTIFLVVRWLENRKYSNETVALLGRETKL